MSWSCEYCGKGYDSDHSTCGLTENIEYKLDKIIDLLEKIEANTRSK